MRTDATLDRLRERLGEDLSVEVAGKKHTLVAGVGSFERVPTGDVEALRSAFAALKAPATLVLSTGLAPDCGEDHVSAVNLTRPIRLPPVVESADKKTKTKKKTKTTKKKRGRGGEEEEEDGDANAMEDTVVNDEDGNIEEDDDDVEEDDGEEDEEEEEDDDEGDEGPWRGWRREARRVVAAAMDKVTSKYPRAGDVQITHYQGGPCDPDEIVTCVVPGGVRRGWTVVNAATAGVSSSSFPSHLQRQAHILASAVQLAHSRAARRCEEQGAVAGGQTVRLVGLKARPELNGEVGLALRFEASTGRWLMRLRNGDGKQVKAENLEPMEGGGGRVLAFWGDARWSRAQLLGEIARGHWGLCRAGVSDFTSPASELFEGLEGRVAFAPVTEMTEDFMSEARRDMSRFRVAAEGMAAAAEDGEGGEGEGEERDGVDEDEEHEHEHEGNDDDDGDDGEAAA